MSKSNNEDLETNTDSPGLDHRNPISFLYKVLSFTEFSQCFRAVTDTVSPSVNYLR